MNSNVPMYYTEDAIEFIRSRSGFDYDVVSQVLELEEDYMRSIGLIIEEMEEEE